MLSCQEYQSESNPVSHPKHAPRPNIRKNSPSGNQAPLALNPPLLLSSFNANITNMSIALAMNSEKNWLAFVRSGCGYVQKIPAVAVLEGGTVRRPEPPSKLLMPLT